MEPVIYRGTCLATVLVSKYQDNAYEIVNFPTVKFMWGFSLTYLNNNRVRNWIVREVQTKSTPQGVVMKFK